MHTTNLAVLEVHCAGDLVGLMHLMILAYLINLSVLVQVVSLANLIDLMGLMGLVSLREVLTLVGGADLMCDLVRLIKLLRLVGLMWLVDLMILVHLMGLVDLMCLLDGLLYDGVVCDLTWYVSWGLLKSLLHRSIRDWLVTCCACCLGDLGWDVAGYVFWFIGLMRRGRVEFFPIRDIWLNLLFGK